MISNKLLGYKLNLSGFGQYMFAGVKIEEILDCVRNEIEGCEGLDVDERPVITLTPMEITEEEIENMPEFQGW